MATFTFSNYSTNSYVFIDFGNGDGFEKISPVAFDGELDSYLDDNVGSTVAEIYNAFSVANYLYPKFVIATDAEFAADNYVVFYMANLVDSTTYDMDGDVSALTGSPSGHPAFHDSGTDYAANAVRKTCLLYTSDAADE